MAGVPVAPFLGAAAPAVPAIVGAAGAALFQAIVDCVHDDIANNQAATMAAIGANTAAIAANTAAIAANTAEAAADRAAAAADHAVAMAAIAANTAAIAANRAAAVANHAVAMAAIAANQAAIAAISRPFSFESHCSIVRTSNQALLDVHAVVTPLPVPAPVAGNLQLFPLQPPAWPAAGCTSQDLMRLDHQLCDQLIQAYNLGMHLPVQAAPVGVKVKRNIIMAHLGLKPWAH